MGNIPQSLSERELLDIARSSGPEVKVNEARQQLLDAYEPLFKKICSGLKVTFGVNNEDDWDVLMQAARLAFLHAVEKIEPREHDGMLGSYAWRFVRKAVIQCILEQESPILPSGALCNRKDRTVCDPSDLILDDETREAVNAVLGTLAPHRQKVIKQVFFEGVEQVEVARDLGISPQALGQSLRRCCRSELRKKLAAFDPAA